MMLRRMLEGALKCALRDLLLDDETSDCLLITKLTKYQVREFKYLLALTLTIVTDGADRGQGVDC